MTCRINTTLYIGINVRDMHITMRVACRIARVATSVFTLAGLIVSAVAHAPCAVAFCSDAIQVIDSSTRIYQEKNGEKSLGWKVRDADFITNARFEKSAPNEYFAAVERLLPVATVQKIVKRSMNFDDRFC